MQALQEQVQHLQFEVEVLKETLAVLKKDPGVDLTALKNREEAVIIGALRDKYALPMLLTYFHMARSSYFYQQAVMNHIGFPRKQRSIWLSPNSSGAEEKRYSTL